MAEKKAPTDYSDFIRARAKTLSKVVVARLEAIEDLYVMIDTAKKDYQRKVKIKTAVNSKP